MDGVDELLALVGLERRRALDGVFRLRRLVLGEMAEQARHRAARLGERQQADAVGGEFVAREGGEDLLQQAQRVAGAHGLVHRRPLGQPDEGRGIAVRLGEQAVEQAVELAGRSLDQAVRQEIERPRIGLLVHGVAVDDGPVLAALADHGVGALAQEPLLDAREDPLRLIGQEIVRRPVDLVDDLRAAALDGEPDLEGEAGIVVRHPLADRGEIGGHAVAQPLVAGPLAAEALDLLARLGALEGLPHRLQGVAAAVGPAVGLAGAAAARHHLGVLAGGGPPGGPLGFGDQPGQDVADLAGGERPVGSSGARCAGARGA